LLALAAALAKDPGGAERIAALACDTDGIDGNEDNAGAIVCPNTIARAASRGVAIKQAMAQNDAYGFFAALGNLVVTGPTLTNVNDVRALLGLARERANLSPSRPQAPTAAAAQRQHCGHTR